MGIFVKRNVWEKVREEKFGKSWEGKSWESLGKVVKANFWGKCVRKSLRKVVKEKFGKSCEGKSWEKV